MKENELYLVKNYKFDNPILTKIDSILDKCFKDCVNNYFHKFIYEVISDFKLIKITNIEIFSSTISDKIMNL